MIRQAYFYEGEDHIDDEYIKTIARRCASCARDFGCSYCTNCQFNPAQFVEFNRAKMLRTAFYIKNQERIGYHSKPSAGGHSEPSRGEAFLKFLALCAGLLIIILAVKNSVDTTQYSYSAPASTYNKQVQPVKKGKSDTSLKNVEHEVQRVLYKVRDNIRDVNRDGEINCQDYCLLFCDYYSTAQIVYNKHIGDSGHVFIRVHTDDGWLYIEPQNTNNYYAYLGKQSAEHKKKWAEDVLNTLKSKYDLKNDIFYIFGGKSYYEHLIPHLHCIVFAYKNSNCIDLNKPTEYRNGKVYDSKSDRIKR